MSVEEIEKIVYEFTRKGFQIEPDAFRKLIEVFTEYREINKNEIIKEIIKRKSGELTHSTFVTIKDIEEILPKKEELEGKIEYEDIKADVEVIRDPGNEIKILEGIEGFKNYFLNRYTKLLKIVNSRPSQKSFTKIDKISNNGKDVKIVGLVKEKKVVKDKVILEVEDPTGVLKIVSKQDNQNRTPLEVLPDQLVIVEISSIKEGLAYASRIEFPEIPDTGFQTKAPEVYALLLSDLHIGSKSFQKETFEHLLHWLQGYHGDKEIIRKLKYIIIAGDLVDGVGIYPNQEKELEETDIRKQYILVAQYIEQIPKHIQVIIIPGNHDATRQALPQPSIPKKYCEELYRMDNVKMYGDPLEIKLHGINFLVYHGRSLDDVFAYSPSSETSRPENAMRLLLRARHLAPVFGARTIIAPAEEDSLVIDTPPDVFHAGHVHIFGYTKYRNTLIINSGTFQNQTMHQKSIGINPTPGLGAIVNLNTLEVFEKDFNKITIQHNLQRI
ncbi:MAG: DNA-directed DNA polymerase II small subunit [Nitrososphaeria archaeon]